MNLINPSRTVLRTVLYGTTQALHGFPYRTVVRLRLPAEIALVTLGNGP